MGKCQPWTRPRNRPRKSLATRRRLRANQEIPKFWRTIGTSERKRSAENSWSNRKKVSIRLTKHCGSIQSRSKVSPHYLPLPQPYSPLKRYVLPPLIWFEECAVVGTYPRNGWSGGRIAGLTPLLHTILYFCTNRRKNFPCLFIEQLFRTSLDNPVFRTLLSASLSRRQPGHDEKDQVKTSEAPFETINQVRNDPNRCNIVYLVLVCSSPSPCKRCAAPGVQAKVSGPRNPPRCPSAPATNSDRPCWWSGGCHRSWTRSRPARTGSAHPPADHSRIVLERKSVGVETIELRLNPSLNYYSRTCYVRSLVNISDSVWNRWNDIEHCYYSDNRAGQDGADRPENYRFSFANDHSTSSSHLSSCAFIRCLFVEVNTIHHFSKLTTAW